MCHVIIYMTVEVTIGKTYIGLCVLALGHAAKLDSHESAMCDVLNEISYWE